MTDEEIEVVARDHELGAAAFHDGLPIPRNCRASFFMGYIRAMAEEVQRLRAAPKDRE